MQRALLGCLLLFPIAGWSDLRPWYERALELRPKIAYTFQQYNQVDSRCGNYHSRDHFLNFSIGTSLDPWAIELETTIADTRRHSWYYDDFAITGRYLWMDDVVGDPVSLVTGLTISTTSHIGRSDVSNFFHGGIQGELHAAIGKETTCFDTWTSRWWGVCGLGVADLGSPWIRLNGAYEVAFTAPSRVRLFVDSLWGMGGNRLNMCHHFHGYGSIHHQSIDLGASAYYAFACWDGILELSYARRLYAKNCPKHVNLVTLSLEYPLGL